MNSINFVDIIILEAAAKTDTPTQNVMIGTVPVFDGAVNALLTSRGILINGTMDVRYGRRLTSVNTFLLAVEKWRALGYMEISRSYEVTEAGRDFLESLPRDWRKYPLVIPFEERGNAHYLDLANARFVHDL